MKNSELCYVFLHVLLASRLSDRLSAENHETVYLKGCLDFMSLTLIGRKRGMTRLFTSKGIEVPCSIIEIEPNVISQIKSLETDG